MDFLQFSIQFFQFFLFFKFARMATSMFKWKPDFESAATEYQKAATCFKNAKAHEQAKEAFLKEADCSYKLK